jgi:hypothetical protein
MSKLNVLFIDAFGNSDKRLMEQLPRVGDTVPVFHSRGEVTKVVWFPIRLDARFSDTDVLITLS